MVEILRELHYRVLEAHDADSALGIVDRNDVQVDLLLTDVVLPGMNGRQLAEELKVRQPGIRVLFMSGYSRDALVHEGRLDPGVELMQKPLTQAMLATKERQYELAAELRTYLRGRPGKEPLWPGKWADRSADMLRIDLEAAGHEVGFFAIFDTWVIENNQIRFLWKIDYYSGRFQDFWRMSLSDKRKTDHGSKKPDMVLRIREPRATERRIRKRI